MAIKIDDHVMCLEIDGAVIASAREDGDGRWPDRRVGLLLLARAAEPGGTGWSAEQELADSYTLTELDRHPVAFAGRAQHFPPRGHCVRRLSSPPGAVGRRASVMSPRPALVDQVVGLATLTAVGDLPCATCLPAVLPNQAELNRFGAEALVVWAHRLHSGPG
jgi:hypothetical protein